MYKGIDISKWQGDFTLPKKYEDIDFAIIKLGGSDDGYYEDSKFQRNYDYFTSKNKHIGGYYYSTATTVEQANKEFTQIISIINGRKFDYPIFIDIECEEQINHPLDTNIAITHLLKKLWDVGFYCGYYTTPFYRSKFRLNCIDCARYPFWVAHWSTNMPEEISENRGMWQCGICDDLDIDISYVDFPEIIRQIGFNNHRTNEYYERIAYQVIRGLWGCGEERKKLLTEAGLPYDIIQNIVNKLV